MKTQEIPQADPGRGAAAHCKDIEEAMRRVLLSGNYILGEEVRRFEKRFAGEISGKYCYGVANGTDAIKISLLGAGIEPGDLIVAPSFAPGAVATAVLLAGAIPVLVDVCAKTFTLSPSLVEDTILHIRKNNSLYGNRRLAGILLVHLFGHPCRMQDFLAIAARHDLPLFEDCAQAHGSTWGGSKCGSFGKTSAFSFYPTKNLAALGDAGCIITNDPDCAEKVSLLRQYGWKRRYISDTFGFNSRLDDLQAAILSVKLPHLIVENEMRRSIAAFYTQQLHKLPLILPSTLPEAQHTFHQYVIRSEDREALREHLKMHGVASSLHYPEPIHTQKAFAERIYFGQGGLKETQSACRSALSLPMFPYLEKGETERVAAAINSFFG